MGQINVNFAEVEGSFEAIPAGRYPVVIEKVEVRESKSSDHNYFNWEMTISEGEHEGRKQWMITSLSPRALFRLKDVMGALGYDIESEDFEFVWDDDEEITPQKGPLLIEPELSGTAATAIITVENYEGKDRNRVDDLVGAEDEVAPRKASSSKSSGASKSSGSASKRRALR